MLEIKDLSVSYGMIEAVKGVDITIKEGEICTLIGANGAGKTTIMHTISGLLAPKSGSILLDGEDLLKMDSEEIVKRGVIQVPEGRRIFQKMSVYENILLGAYQRKGDLDSEFEYVYSLFPILKERTSQMAGTLSGGEQQMLAIARALMARPKIMLLDEPSMGLAPLLVKNIFDIIKTINSTGTTIFLVEQNANMALAIANHAYVMETGRIALEGSGEELLASDKVQKLYLGG
ncbi:MAG: ABC transporter ATP-binding protein [Erysipelotrichaceae bacterium]|nr:ABC transporter ATP-binding protein [Erysipelotrichaceae bacterium]